MNINKLTVTDNFFIGMALANHANYLSQNWEGGNESRDSVQTGVRLTLAYGAGMVEHAIYAAFKVCTIAAFFFIATGSACNYLFSKQSDIKLFRAKISFVIFMEAISGLVIDLAGVVCPPAAYKAHIFIKKEFTVPFIGRHIEGFEPSTAHENSPPSCLDFFGKIG